MTWGYYDDYYRELSWRSKNPNGKPLSEKEQKDLELLEKTKHYEQVLRKKISLQKPKENEKNDD